MTTMASAVIVTGESGTAVAGAGTAGASETGEGGDHAARLVTTAAAVVVGVAVVAATAGGMEAFWIARKRPPQSLLNRQWRSSVRRSRLPRVFPRPTFASPWRR